MDVREHISYFTTSYLTGLADGLPYHTLNSHFCLSLVNEKNGFFENAVLCPSQILTFLIKLELRPERSQLYNLKLRKYLPYTV